jgi:hypothetical protein
MRQTPHLANTSRAGGEFGEESDAFLKQLAPLKTVIELSEHSNDQVPQGCTACQSPCSSPRRR